jgi:hypothetical protein
MKMVMPMDLQMDTQTTIGETIIGTITFTLTTTFQIFTDGIDLIDTTEVGRLAGIPMLAGTEGTIGAGDNHFTQIDTTILGVMAVAGATTIGATTTAGAIITHGVE